MDVQCERCKTEYEFDDALVSGRGTTVRCTQCGHQFKVRKGDAGPSEPPPDDLWVVTTTVGKQLTYTTLRELQRAIMAKLVARSDTLTRGTRGDAPPRLLGSIAELEPFFEGRGSTRPPPGSGGSVAQRLPAPPATPSEAMLELPKRTPAWGVDEVPASARPSAFPPARARSNTLRPPVDGPAVPPPAAARPTMPGLDEIASAATAMSTSGPTRALEPAPIVHVGAPAVRPDSATHTPPMPAAVLTHEAHDAEPPTQPRPAYIDASRAASAITYTPPTPAYQPELSSPLPPPTAPRRVLASSIDEDAMADAMRASAFSDPDSLGMPRRRRVGGWMVALVLLAGVAVVGFAVARPYLATMGKPAASAPALDEKTQQFLNDGDKALADGNLDAAKENYDKALARDDKSQRVLVAVARLAAARADVPWLRARVLPDSVSASDDVKATKQNLSELAAAARKAADDALAVSPDEQAAIRAKIDASRISGERDTARRLVSKIIGQATQPETAYVLAALDLAEPEPVWPTVIDRLRLAAQGEGNAGRARAALIYALARSGDKLSAKLELEKLDRLARPHPLLGALRAFVDQAKVKPVVDGGAASARVVDVSQLPTGGKPGEPPLEGRGPTQQAMNALAKGDKDRARAIYEAQIARNPNDSEALSGLGDVSRAQGNSAGAIAAYKRALGVNPSYLPAIVGLADTYWATGNRGEAMRLYKEITERFPEGAYPAYVKQRAEGGAPAPTPAPTESAPATPSATPTAATSSASATPTPATTTTPKPANSDGF